MLENICLTEKKNSLKQENKFYQMDVAYLRKYNQIFLHFLHSLTNFPFK